MALSINRKYTSIYFSPASRRLSTTFLIIHSTDSDNVAGSIAWFNSPNNKYKSSAHYVIDRDGSLYQLLDENIVAHHAGTSQWTWNGKKYTDLNRHSIGVEMVARQTNSFTPEQLAVLTELSIDISKRKKIVAENTLRHSDVAKKRDPYPPNIDWPLFKKKLSMELNIPTPKKLALYEEDVFDYMKSKENSQNALLHDVKGFIEDMTPYKVLIAIINSNPVLQQEYSAFVAQKHQPK